MLFVHLTHLRSAVKTDQFKKKKKRTIRAPKNSMHDILELLLLLIHFSRVRLGAIPQTAAHQAPPSHFLLQCTHAC